MKAIVLAARTAPTYAGGLAAYLSGLAKTLVDGGVTIDFVCREPSLPGEAPTREAPPRLRVHTGGEPLRLWRSLASRPVFHPLLELWCARHFRTAFAEIPSSTLAIHYVGTGWDFFGFAARAAARRRRVRFTIWPAIHPGAWGDDTIDLRLYRGADTVFCQSGHERLLLQSRGVDPARLTLCGLPPMCLDTGHRTAFREALGLGERPVILFLGRREASKGLPALLDAWTSVLACHPEAVLLIAGPGTLPIPPAPSVFDLGLVDEKTKADALAACDVFCLPSSEESFGIVFAEAWSYARPVICGTAPAPREWIHDGLTGLHSDGTPTGIAACLHRLLADPTLARRLGTAGHLFQKENLSWPHVTTLHRQAFGLTDSPRLAYEPV